MCVCVLLVRVVLASLFVCWLRFVCFVLSPVRVLCVSCFSTCHLISPAFVMVLEGLFMQ